MINQIFVEYENPSKAIAVRKILTVVMACVPNFLISLSENKLEMIVPAETIMEISPIKDRGTLISACMMGHADPNSESGRPKLINAKYIIAISSVYMVTFL